ncbi:hypothetical protein DFJ74DRAFT_711204 [Hyaloraphidium curvatum]|nr:hypothetical protein DFJ74DRAFT_711204 [Hyaloraphidium curvatum]
MALVSWIYPSHQDPAPFLARKERIYSHMVFASTAILIGPLQLWAGLRRSSVRLHRALGLVFSISAAASCAASVSYAAHQAYGNDGGFAGTVSFGFMALAVLCYVARGLIFLVDESARGKRGHGRAMIRAYLCFLGDGLFFRVLANYYLPLRTVGNGYAAWTTSIWISWAMPLLLYEVAEAAWDAAGAASSLPAGTEAAR